MPETRIEQQDTGITRRLNQSGQPYETTRTRWLIAAAVTLALHGGIVAYTKITTADIEKATQTISFLIQSTAQKINSTWTAFTQNREQYDAKREQVTKWRKALKEGPTLLGFDYGDFFLKLPWLEGQLSEEDLKTDQEKLADLIKHYQELQKKQSEGFFSIIKKIIEEQFGKYVERSAQLHGLINNKKGNCIARTQMMISLIQGVFGNAIPMKVRISRQKPEDGREQIHSDLLIKIYDKWHIVSPELPETEIEDIEGVALFETSDYVKTYIGKNDGKPKPNIVKEIETPNENDLDPAPTDSLVDLANNVDPKKLKTHEQKSSQKPAKEKPKTGPIEITMIPVDSKSAAEMTMDSSKPEPQKHQLTSQEVVATALTGEIAITPDIETLEPLRGIRLNRVLISNKDSRSKEYPSFEPLAKTPPREILIAQSSTYRDSQGKRQRIDTKIPDLSPLYGKTTISRMVFDTRNFQEWENILQNFTIQEATIFIGGYQLEQSTLTPLAKSKITKSLKLTIIAREGTMDLAGIDSLPIVPPEFRMELFAKDQKFLNLQALGRVHFTSFETSDHTLDSGVLDGVVIKADTVNFASSPRKPPDRRYLKDIFRTHRVEIFDYETEYSDTALEPVRGMPSLDFLSIEMDSHLQREGKTPREYGHMSYNEIYTGEKPPLDLIPLEGTPIKELQICAGYQLPPTFPAGIALITIVNNPPPDLEAVEKWREHLRTLPRGEHVPPPPAQVNQRLTKDSIPIPEALQKLLQIPKL